MIYEQIRPFFRAHELSWVVLHRENSGPVWPLKSAIKDMEKHPEGKPFMESSQNKEVPWSQCSEDHGN